MKTYVVNGDEFKVDIVIKRSNKNIYFRFKKGIIQITTPKALDDKYITSMLKKHYNKLKKMSENIVSDSIHYLGNEYNLMIYQSDKNNIEFKDNIAYIYTNKIDEHYIYKIIYNKYFELIKDIIEQYHLQYESMFNVSDVKYVIKDVKTYFGQCNSKKKIIVLSAKLAKYDKELILSVLAHELAHFKYQNHSQNYYNYLEMIVPGYRKMQKQLKRLKYNDKY
jgi:predicted metal-dependent hydrolase